MDPNTFVYRDEGHFYSLKTLEQYPGHLSPFSYFKKHFQNNEFNGTVLRLPLRNGEFSQKSKLKQNQITPEYIETVYFSRLIEKASSVLLFLKNITKISAVILHSNHKEEIVFSISIQSPTEDISNVKSRIVQIAQGNAPPMKEPQIFQTEVLIEDFRKKESKKEKWVISHYIDHEEIANFAQLNSKKYQIKLVPWAGLALPISGQQVKGGIFCFLPLPVETSKFFKSFFLNFFFC